MSEKHLFHVRKSALLAIAGCVWLLAGVMFYIMFGRYLTMEKAFQEAAPEV